MWIEARPDCLTASRQNICLTADLDHPWPPGIDCRQIIDHDGNARVSLNVAVLLALRKPWPPTSIVFSSGLWRNDTDTTWWWCLSPVFVTGARVSEFVQVHVEDLHLDSEPPQLLSGDASHQSVVESEDDGRRSVA